MDKKKETKKKTVRKTTPKKTSTTKKTKEHNFGGRPTIMTDDVINKLEQGFLLGLNDFEACLYADISHQTLYNYCKKFPEFVERKELLKNHVKMKAKINLSEKITEEKDLSMSLYYLEKKSKGFQSKALVEIEGNMNVNNPFAELSSEQLKALVNMAVEDTPEE